MAEYVWYRGKVWCIVGEANEPGKGVHVGLKNPGKPEGTGTSALKADTRPCSELEVAAILFFVLHS